MDACRASPPQIKRNHCLTVRVARLRAVVGTDTKSRAMGTRLARIPPEEWAKLMDKAIYESATRAHARKFAALCKVTLRTMERYCHDAFGKRPLTLLRERRIDIGKCLLRESLSVKEVAIILGFKQSSHFCAEFKLFTGITPNEFIDSDNSRAMFSYTPPHNARKWPGEIDLPLPSPSPSPSPAG